ncbi:MAG: hypothetical protein LBT27_07710, partial [Prevotellaceae bacterium]|nr:hypothetical protein [Prevotellaceae bacterium]
MKLQRSRAIVSFFIYAAKAFQSHRVAMISSRFFILENLNNNKMKTNKIHIGKIIEEKVKQSSLSVTKFAELINCTNANV